MGNLDQRGDDSSPTCTILQSTHLGSVLSSSGIFAILGGKVCGLVVFSISSLTNANFVRNLLSILAFYLTSLKCHHFFLHLLNFIWNLLLLLDVLFLTQRLNVRIPLTLLHI